MESHPMNIIDEIASHLFAYYIEMEKNLFIPSERMCEKKKYRCGRADVVITISLNRMWPPMGPKNYSDSVNKACTTWHNGKCKVR